MERSIYFNCIEKKLNFLASEFVRDKNIQLVISILRDKLPENIIENAHIAIELSQQDKLFRIE